MEKQFCEGCTNENPNEPIYCCNAFDCECQGKPQPYFCSEACYQSVIRQDVMMSGKAQSASCSGQGVKGAKAGAYLRRESIKLETLTCQIETKVQSVFITFQLDESE